MKRLLTFLGCLTLSVSCMAPSMLESNQGESALSKMTVRVAQRHDAYVATDGALSEMDREFYISESAQAQSLVIGLPEVNASVLAQSLEPVLQRHDAYVSADASLDDPHREQYLASSDALHDMLEAAGAFK